MANKRQRKKQAKKVASMGSYQHLPFQGSPKSPYIINQNGLRFSKKEIEEFESAVNLVNAKHDEMKERLGNLDRMVDGKPTGQKVSQLYLMNKESDFIVSQRTKNIQRFTSKEQFRNYVEKSKLAATDAYLDYRVGLYKKNMMKAMKNAYSLDEAKDVIMKVRMMPREKFMVLVSSNEELEIGYIGSDQPTHGSLNAIRRALGMKEKEEDSLGQYYDVGE